MWSGLFCIGRWSGLQPASRCVEVRSHDEAHRIHTHSCLGTCTRRAWAPCNERLTMYSLGAVKLACSQAALCLGWSTSCRLTTEKNEYDAWWRVVPVVNWFYSWSVKGREHELSRLVEGQTREECVKNDWMDFVAQELFIWAIETKWLSNIFEFLQLMISWISFR